MHITLWTHWDHVSDYWKASLENPDKVLFLTYEDMKTDPVVCLTKLAKFLDKPFCLEEEWEEVVQKIVRLCSFENLSSLEVNQTAVQHFSPQLAVENRHFLRKDGPSTCDGNFTSPPAEAPQLKAASDKLQGLISVILVISNLL
ncbi:hypothetical protein FXO37_00687 [Capsicum annuum]|nr:hypothetical protein FXO37_00687 [Capsicum annuum]